MSTIDKNYLRKFICARRRSLDPIFQKKSAAQICENLTALELIQNARIIALYYSAQGEADAMGIAQHPFAVDKQWLLPALVDDNQLVFLPFTTQEELVPNKFDIPEPQATQKTCALSDIEVILLPLVAFDEKCNRLGRGKGYYDRTLATIKRSNTTLIGIGYEFQKVEHLNPEPWDVVLDQVVTEKRVYTPRG